MSMGITIQQLNFEKVQIILDVNCHHYTLVPILWKSITFISNFVEVDNLSNLATTVDGVGKYIYIVLYVLIL